MIFIPIATVGARRYRLSRTSWRGIRSLFVGSAWQYIKLYLTGALLNVITVGTYYPFYEARGQTFLISHSHVGNQSFHFDGQGRDLAKDFCLAVLLTPFAFGLNWFWHSAKRQRYYWEHTFFAESRFAFTGTEGELCRLKLANVCLLVFTLGFAWPWTTIRNAHFILDHSTFTGPANLDTLIQVLQSASTTDFSGAMAYGLEGARPLGRLQYGRQFEEEADALGIYMLQAAGIDPQDMIAFYQIMNEKTLNPSGVWAYLSTHPSTEARIQRLALLSSSSLLKNPLLILRAPQDEREEH